MKDKIQNISVLIPVFNESENILLDIISKIDALMTQNKYEKYEIIVIDDGSDKEIDKKTIEKAGARLIRNFKNLGYGAALKAGLRAAEGEIIVITDSDGTYPVDKIPELIRELKDCDMAVGARTGAIVNIPFVRQPAKWILRKVSNYLAGEKIPDLNSGLRAFRKDDAMKFIHLYPQGFSFTTTITLAYISEGMRVKYISINYYKRTSAKSKIRPITDTKNILFTILRTILYFDPLKICLPAGLLLMMASLLVLILSIILQGMHILQNLPDGTISVLLLTGVQIMFIGLLADLIIRRSGK